MKTVFSLGVVSAAVLGAMSVQAAEVTLYGSVSEAIVIKHTTIDTEGSKTSYSLDNAWYGDSNWGITGGEELANGLRVGFTLEGDLEADTGKGSDDGLFNAQSYLSIGNDTWSLFAGHVGALGSTSGDLDVLGQYDPLEAKFGIAGMGLFVSRDIMANNALALSVTPMDGLTFAGALSMGVEDDSGKWRDNTHYYGLSGTYANDALSVSMIVESVQLPKDDTGKNMTFYSLGASYDFGFVKPMLAYQHGEHVISVANESLPIVNASKTDSVLLGATMPLMGGSLMGSVQYLRGKEDASGAKFEAHTVGLGYDYPLSKRTSVYTGVTWSQGKKGFHKSKGDDVRDLNGYQWGFGLKHTF